MPNNDSHTSSDEREPIDWIQEIVIARCKELDFTAHRIALLAENRIDELHIHRFVTRRASMGSHKLQHVLKVLGLTITLS